MTDRNELAETYVDIVFDGPPSHESGRFVEVEDAAGKSIKFGEWVERPDGYWGIPSLRDALDKSVALQSHYAGLLNAYDGGQRRQFKDGQDWIERLRECEAGSGDHPAVT